MAKRHDELRRYAAIGAAARIKELQAEIDRIRAAFPAQGKPARTRKAGRKRKRTMSPEGRKRISDAQKARWARQKAKK